MKLETLETRRDSSRGNSRASVVRSPSFLCLHRRRWNVALISILIISAMLRIVWGVVVPVHPVSDGYAYDVFARNLAKGIGYAWDPTHMTAHWPVGTSFIYSVLYRIFGFTYIPIVVFNVLVSLGTIWLSMTLARHWFDERVAIIAGFVFALWPSQIEFISVLGSELIFNFILLLWLAVWELAPLNRWPKVVLIGFLAAATCYIRPVALVLPVVFCSVEILRERKYLLPIARAAIILLTMALLIAPWSIRNTRLFGRFVQISTNGGVNFWEGNNPTGNGETEGLPPETAKMQEADRDIYLGNIAKAYVRQYPGRFVLRTLKKAVWLYDHETIGVHWNLSGLTERYGAQVILPLKLLNDLYWWLVLVLGLIGSGVLMVQRGIWASITSIPILMWLYFTALYAVFVVQDRYHFPTLPFIAMLAGVALNAFAQLRATQETPAVVTTSRERR